MPDSTPNADTQQGTGPPRGWFRLDNEALAWFPIVGPTAFAVFVALARFADEEGRCWPAVATIADLLGLHRRNVQRAQKRLEEAGAVTLERSKGGRGRSATNRYRLVPYPPCKCGGSVTPQIVPVASEPRLSAADSPRLSAADSPPNKDQGKKTKGRRPKGAVAEYVIPFTLDTPPFVAAWKDWIAFRREERLSIKPRCLQAQLDFLADLGPEKAVESIRRSIRAGWKGVFEPTARANGQPAPVKPDATLRPVPQF